MPIQIAIRRRTRRCPCCGGSHDGHVYERDAAQRQWGYPRKFRVCQTCACPLVEIGPGHCRPFTNAN